MGADWLRLYSRSVIWKVNQHHSEQVVLRGNSLRLGSRSARLSSQLLANTGFLVFVQVTRGTSAATALRQEKQLWFSLLMLA